MSARTERFHELHRSGTFVMPNPWDVGSARFLEAMGFPALATTSSGHAATLGREDQQVTLDEAIAHVADLCDAVDVPLNVDLEWGFAESPDGLAAVIDRVAGAGAAGFSLEDYDPGARATVPVDVAAARIAAGAEAANRHGLVLTARAENHLYGVTDLDDTLDRLDRYVAAGAHAVYAPGLTRPDEIARVVAIGTPVNVLAFPGAPSVAELGAIGVRRISTGARSPAWRTPPPAPPPPNCSQTGPTATSRTCEDRPHVRRSTAGLVTPTVIERGLTRRGVAAGPVRRHRTVR